MQEAAGPDPLVNNGVEAVERGDAVAVDKGRGQGNGAWIPCQTSQPDTRSDRGAQALLQSHSVKKAE